MIRDCTGGAFSSVPELWQYHPLVRPFVAWTLPQLRAIKKHKQKAARYVTSELTQHSDHTLKPLTDISFRLFAPVLEARLKAMEQAGFKPPSDLIQLVIDGSPNGKGRSLDYQIEAQIGTGRAALFTTATTVFHILYDLCTRPEYIEPLRREALEVGEVTMTRANVAKLVKLDSFIREAQRFNKFMLGTMLSARQQGYWLTVYYSGHHQKGHKAFENCNWRRFTSRYNLRSGHPFQSLQPVDA